jgi:hypothetical protein
MNETTRMFPRTLNEAFPSSVESERRMEVSQWFETHKRPYDKWFTLGYSFCAGFIVSMLIFLLIKG